MEWLSSEWDDFTNSTSRAYQDCRRGLHHTSWHHIALALLGAVLAVAGMSTQIISLNDWLASFPESYEGWPAGGPFAVLTVASIMILVIYTVVGIVWYIIYRPALGCLRNPSVWWHGALGGVAQAANGWLVVVATPHVNEILQALLLSTQIPWTVILALLFRINHGKNYCHFLVVFSILLSVGGIVVGTFAVEEAGGVSYPDIGAWATIFAVGILPAALMNVVAAHFFQTCSYDEDEDNPDSVGAGSRADENSSYGAAEGDIDPMLTATLEPSTVAPSEDARSQGSKRDSDPLIIAAGRGPKDALEKKRAAKKRQASDMAAEGEAVKTGELEEIIVGEDYPRVEIGTAKVIFLVLSCFFQCITLGVLFPLDWAPFFGPNAGNSTAAVHSLKNGIDCVMNKLGDDTECANNLRYYILFSFGFATTNAGQVLLTSFNAVVTSMVMNAASPITALILELAPSLAPHPQHANIVMCLFSFVMILLGSTVYSAWEQITSIRQKEQHVHNAEDDNVADTSSYGTLNPHDS